MNILVAIMGLASGLVSMLGVVAPDALRNLILYFKKGRMWRAVLTRLVGGIVFVIAAPACRHPEFIRIFGYFVIVAAMVMIFARPKGLEAFAESWAALPDVLIRTWCLGSAAFCVYIVYASGWPLLSF